MIKFYQILSGYNVIGKIKNKRPLYTVSVPLKQDTDILNPKLLIYSNSSLEIMNYCYISEFSRYYFIEKIDPVRKNLYRISCKVDVLESYKIQILNSKDVDFLNSVEVMQAVINATETPNRDVSYILSTIGG